MGWINVQRFASVRKTCRQQRTRVFAETCRFGRPVQAHPALHPPRCVECCMEGWRKGAMRIEMRWARGTETNAPHTSLWLPTLKIRASSRQLPWPAPRRPPRPPCSHQRWWNKKGRGDGGCSRRISYWWRQKSTEERRRQHLLEMPQAGVTGDKAGQDDKALITQAVAP
jgi:hypothetical protein